jgi:hypothetical protein
MSTKKDSLLELYDTIYRNAIEDRETAKKAYDALKVTVNHRDDYEAVGKILADLLDLVSKPTSQLIELAKMQKKSDEKGDDLSEEQKSQIYDEIGNL